MHEISIRAEDVLHIGRFVVSNSLLLAVCAMVLVTFVAVVIRFKLRTVPGRLQGFVEMIFEELFTLMDSALGSRDKSLKYFPLIASIFLFVVVSNWLGLLPLGPITINHAPLFRAPTTDLNFTIALAIISVLAVNILGVVAIGLWKHLGKFFNFKSPIMLFVGLLELVSEFVKIISFSFRLFGNIFAGEVLLLIIGFLLPYVVPLPFLFLEVFVGVIQGFIFAMLTLVFISMATNLEASH